MSKLHLSRSLLRLDPNDNVAIALEDVRAGSELGADNIARETIPRGHKVALAPLALGETVRKFGQVIGAASSDIAPGEHVHTHNLQMDNSRIAAGGDSEPAGVDTAGLGDSFLGYHRDSGRVGTRNFIGILTTVNCAGSVARFIAEAAEKAGLLEEYPGLDGIVPIAHSSGCGMSASDEGYETLLRTLAGYARNPNFGAILLVGLGCEVMQIAALTGGAGLRDSSRLRHMTIQQVGGTRATIDRALGVLREMAVETAKEIRGPAPASALMLGMQCGGSDAYSGLTANPALGVASDILVGFGGTSILSETPEIYGAEHLLTARAKSTDIADALLERITWWEDYCRRAGGEMNNNPSPGNKKGGLTTILEKSLGAVAKGGRSPLSAVAKFGEPISTPGLVFMDSPGYDPCSVTGQIASGANLIAFTTGRGSVSGYKPVPGIKLATNSEMYARMKDDMDINCGDIVEGVSVEEKGRQIFRLMLEVASGKQSKSEALGFGGVEFVPWQMGAVM